LTNEKNIIAGRDILLRFSKEILELLPKYWPYEN
jgi:hypothetical protein